MKFTKILIIAALILTPLNSAMAERISNPLPSIKKSSLTVEIKIVAEGLNLPVQLTHAGDASGRRFVVDRSGQVHILDLTGATQATPFLDVAAVGALGPDAFKTPSNFDEFGLLSIAFHPDFDQTGTPGAGRVYTYSSVTPGAPAFGGFDDDFSNSDHQSVIHEWQVDPSNADIIDIGTRREILRIDQPEPNHNGGMIAFSPIDNMLYIGLGDGGGANDVHSSDNGDVPHGQNIETALGSLLRINPIAPVAPAGSYVDSGRVSDNGAYTIPSTNPFFDLESEPPTLGLDETFAYGLRNPYRFNFDTENGVLWIGDVGQKKIEEVNRIDPSTESGLNFGWNIKEGSFGFEVDESTGEGFVNDTTEFPEGLTDPIGQYDHGDGISIIGGYAYHGSLIPPLEGKYLFAESYYNSTGHGRLLMMDVDSGLIEELTIGTDRLLGAAITGTGMDQGGEFYLTGLVDLFAPNSGVVLQVVVIPEPSSIAFTFFAIALISNRRPRPKTSKSPSI